MASAEVIRWLDRLCGIHEPRITDGLSWARSWKSRHVDRELLSRWDLDSLLAVVLLADAVRDLESAGVPRTKLISKIRNDADVWPTFAEFRAAAILLRSDLGEFRFVLHPAIGGDYGLVDSTGAVTPVEFKAIGLSDREAAFCRRMDASLDMLTPPRGLLSLHAHIETPALRVNLASRAEMFDSAVRTMSEFQNYPPGLAGVTVTGQFSEAWYMRRFINRLTREVARQLPSDREGWAAFYWTNGAPTKDVVAQLDWDQIPLHVAGVMFIGTAVAFPQPATHSYVVILPRSIGSEEQLEIGSNVDAALGERVFSRFEKSSGVRAMRLVDQREDIEVMRRNGLRRILPVNFLIDPDPTGAGRSTGRELS